MARGIEFHENGIEGISDGPCMTIDAVGGKIVVSVYGDTDGYSEAWIDFLADDGREMQLAVVGQTHVDGEEPKMHGYVFDGVSGDDAAYMHDIEVSERSYWYE